MKLLGLIVIIFSSFFTYAQQQNDWEKRTAFEGGKRERAIAFAIADSGYVGMGIDTAEMTHNDLWKYDPAVGTWTQKASLPGSTRRNAMAVTIDGKGYVGMGADSATSWMGTILSDWWQYDASANSWTPKALYPGGYDYLNNYLGPGVYYGAAFEINGKGYISGGKMGPDQYASDLWEYDPQLDSWTRKADFPGLDRYQLSSFTVDGKGYVGMGVDHDLYRKDWWQYDPLLDSWIQVSDLPGVERGAASTFTIGQRGFVVFGTDGGFKDELWEYNPYSDSWNIRANFPGGERKNAIAFAIGDSAYAGIGKGSSGKRRNFYRYYPLFPVGIELQTIDLNIYPNPVHDILQTISSHSTLNYQMTNIKGQEVLKWTGSNVDVSHLKAGTYFLNVFESNKHIITKKIILQ